MPLTGTEHVIDVRDGLLLPGFAGAEDDSRAINALLLKAGTAEQKNDPDGAIQAYSQILKLRPDDEPILADRGNAYADKKDYAHAIADFTEAIKALDELSK